MECVFQALFHVLIIMSNTNFSSIDDIKSAFGFDPSNYALAATFHYFQCPQYVCHFYSLLGDGKEKSSVLTITLLHYGLFVKKNVCDLNYLNDGYYVIVPDCKEYMCSPVHVTFYLLCYMPENFYIVVSEVRYKKYFDTLIDPTVFYWLKERS